MFQVSRADVPRSELKKPHKFRGLHERFMELRRSRPCADLDYLYPTAEGEKGLRSSQGSYESHTNVDEVQPSKVDLPRSPPLGPTKTGPLDKKGSMDKGGLEKGSLQSVNAKLSTSQPTVSAKQTTLAPAKAEGENAQGKLYILEGFSTLQESQMSNLAPHRSQGRGVC